MSSTAEFAQVLLAKALDDAYVVDRLAADSQAPAWVIGFHAQQAVEKTLKSILAGANVVFPRTHNIAMLLALLQQNDLPLPEQAAALERLTPFGVAARYEGSVDEPLTLDRNAVNAEVAQAIHWGRTTLAALLNPAAGPR